MGFQERRDIIVTYLNRLTLCCRNEVLGIGKPGAGLENLGPVHWELVLCYLLGWIFVALTLSKGVKSSGKVRMLY